MSTSRSSAEDFETIERLGSGSFGTVYKVRRIQDGNSYVIKEVRISELTYEEQVNAINEVKLLAQMDNPNVVRYYDSFLTQDSLHIVMEYCNKGDVQSLLKKAKSKGLYGLRESLIWNIGLQIVLGLYYIHRKKVLHRDLKTANVFLEKRSTDTHYKAKIGDLGVAKLLETSTAFARTIIGTPYYLSPELCADQPYRDKSDCWALGVILYECCTLQHPFDARNQCALILKIIQSPIPPFSPKQQISKPLQRMVAWLLEKDPARRPSVRMLLCERVVREALKQKDNLNLQLPVELQDARLTNYLDPDGDMMADSSPLFGRKSGTGSDSNSGTSSGQASNCHNSPALPAPASRKPHRTSSRRQREGGGGSGDGVAESRVSGGSGADGAGSSMRGDWLRRGGQQVVNSGLRPEQAREGHQIRSNMFAQQAGSGSRGNETKLGPAVAVAPQADEAGVGGFDVRCDVDTMNSDEILQRLQQRQRHRINIVDDSSIETLDTYQTQMQEAQRMPQMRHPQQQQHHKRRQQHEHEQEQEQEQIYFERQGKVWNQHHHPPEAKSYNAKGLCDGREGGGIGDDDDKDKACEPHSPGQGVADAEAQYEHDDCHTQVHASPVAGNKYERVSAVDGGDMDLETVARTRADMDQPVTAVAAVAMSKAQYPEIDERDLVDYKRAQESFAVRRLQSVVKVQCEKDASGNAAGAAMVSHRSSCNSAVRGEAVPISSCAAAAAAASSSGLSKDHTRSSSCGGGVTAIGDSDNDPYVLECLIKEYRDKALHLLGEHIFRQVYDLCYSYMMVEIAPTTDGSSGADGGGTGGGNSSGNMSMALLSHLERSICDHLGAGIDVACEVVFNVKLLLALESRLREHQQQRRHQEQYQQ